MGIGLGTHSFLPNSLFFLHNTPLSPIHPSTISIHQSTGQPREVCTRSSGHHGGQVSQGVQGPPQIERRCALCAAAGELKRVLGGVCVLFFHAQPAAHAKAKRKPGLVGLRRLRTRRRAAPPPPPTENCLIARCRGGQERVPVTMLSGFLGAGQLNTNAPCAPHPLICRLSLQVVPCAHNCHPAAPKPLSLIAARRQNHTAALRAAAQRPEDRLHRERRGKREHRRQADSRSGRP